MGLSCRDSPIRFVPPILIAMIGLIGKLWVMEVETASEKIITVSSAASRCLGEKTSNCDGTALQTQKFHKHFRQLTPSPNCRMKIHLSLEKDALSPLSSHSLFPPKGCHNSCSRIRPQFAQLSFSNEAPHFVIKRERAHYINGASLGECVRASCIVS